MKIDVTKSMFRDAFQVFESTDRYNQLGGYDGLGALYDYLIELEESCDIELGLDPIALCCDYAYYTDIEEFQNDYGVEEYPDMESIADTTTVIPVTGDAFIIQQF